MPRPILKVGTGSVAKRHTDNLRTLIPDAQFVVATRQLDRLVMGQVGPLDILLDDRINGPEIAIIANATAYHVQDAIKCAKAGCHLFIEKPLSHNMEGVEELSQLCEQRGLTTMVGYQYRFHPRLLRLREQLSAGEFGQVVSVRAVYGDWLPGWHPGEDHRTSYAADAEQGGTILTLSHTLDYLCWLFGDVLKVRCVARDVPTLETPCRDDVAELLLEFASGTIGSVHLDYMWPRYSRQHTLEIIGTDRIEAIDFEEDKRDRDAMFVAEMREFLAAVAERRPSSIPLSEGIATLNLCLEARHDAGL